MAQRGGARRSLHGDDHARARADTAQRCNTCSKVAGAEKERRATRRGRPGAHGRSLARSIRPAWGAARARLYREAMENRRAKLSFAAMRGYTALCMCDRSSRPCTLRCRVARFAFRRAGGEHAHGTRRAIERRRVLCVELPRWVPPLFSTRTYSLSRSLQKRRLRTKRDQAASGQRSGRERRKAAGAPFAITPQRNSATASTAPSSTVAPPRRDARRALPCAAA
eukprot:IDg18022t1